jgi:hypothetical protein
MVPVLVLAIIAVGLIKSLMSVVGHDEAELAPTQAYDPTVELRANINDDIRAFLLPARAEPASFEPAAVEQAAVDLTNAAEADAIVP